MEFLHDDQIIEAIGNLVSNRNLQEEPLNIAVAYWGKDAIEKTGLQKRIERNPANVRVVCDLLGGSCNPDPIAKMRKLGAAVKTCNGMHAKVWNCGDHVIVGSANVSANGLGFEEIRMIRGNREAAVFTRDKGVAKSVNSWFTKMWNEGSKLVNDGDIKKATEQWKTRSKPSRDSRGSRPNSLLERIRQTWVPDQRREKIRILVWEEAESPVPDKNGERIDKYVNSDITRELYTRREWGHSDRRSYWRCSNKNWEFQKDDIYLDFTYPPRRKRLQFNGIYRVVSHDSDHVAIGDEFIVMSYDEKNKCNEYNFPEQEQKEITEMIKRYSKEYDLKEDSATNLLNMGIGQFVTSCDEITEYDINLASERSKRLTGLVTLEERSTEGSKFAKIAFMSRKRGKENFGIIRFTARDGSSQSLRYASHAEAVRIVLRELSQNYTDEGLLSKIQNEGHRIKSQKFGWMPMVGKNKKEIYQKPSSKDRKHGATQLDHSGWWLSDDTSSKQKMALIESVCEIARTKLEMDENSDLGY